MKKELSSERTRTGDCGGHVSPQDGELCEGGHGVHSPQEHTQPWAAGTITITTSILQTREAEALKG